MDETADRRSAKTVVVVAGGDPPDPDVRSTIPASSAVVAADSGADTALALGLVVDEIVGDLDSVSGAVLDAVVGGGAAVDAHQRDKDATDLALAVAAALHRDPTCILVLGGLGGRLDHELANLTLLAGDELAGVDVVIRSGRVTVSIVRPGRRTMVCGDPGDLVSLVPMHGSAVGVTTDGLRWPLADAELPVGTTIGISNELVERQGWVTCAGGVLLAVQPGLPAPFVPTRSGSSNISQGDVR